MPRRQKKTPAPEPDNEALALLNLQKQVHQITQVRATLANVMTPVRETPLHNFTTVVRKTAERSAQHKAVWIAFFFGRRHLPFGWSPTLRLTCGPAGNRTTTGSLSALSKDTALPTSPQGRLQSCLDSLSIRLEAHANTVEETVKQKQLTFLLHQRQITIQAYHTDSAASSLTGCLGERE